MNPHQILIAPSKRCDALSDDRDHRRRGPLEVGLGVGLKDGQVPMGVGADVKTDQRS